MNNTFRPKKRPVAAPASEQPHKTKPIGARCTVFRASPVYIKKALAAAALILLAAVMALVYAAFREQAVSGSKAITITVVDAASTQTVYSLKTDAPFLRQAMDEAEGLSYSGAEGPYGLMIDTVNGETADFSANGAYWGFFVNGQYCNYGIDEQPVEDGDAFTIAYTK